MPPNSSETAFHKSQSLHPLSLIWAEESTFHEIFTKGLTVVDFVAVAGANAETGKILVEVDKEHF
jgi:hypothetical protein